MVDAAQFRFTTEPTVVETSQGVKRLKAGVLVSDAATFDTPADAVASLGRDLRMVHARLEHDGGRADTSRFCLMEPCVGIRQMIRAIEQQIPATVQ